MVKGRQTRCKTLYFGPATHLKYTFATESNSKRLRHQDTSASDPAVFEARRMKTKGESLSQEAVSPTGGGQTEEPKDH